jgi:hypothetical protein
MLFHKGAIPSLAVLPYMSQSNSYHGDDQQLGPSAAQTLPIIEDSAGLPHKYGTHR